MERECPHWAISSSNSIVLWILDGFFYSNDVKKAVFCCCCSKAVLDFGCIVFISSSVEVRTGGTEKMKSATDRWDTKISVTAEKRKLLEDTDLTQLLVVTAQKPPPSHNRSRNSDA